MASKLTSIAATASSEPAEDIDAGVPGGATSSIAYERTATGPRWYACAEVRYWSVRTVRSATRLDRPELQP
jgi:hypothetical protein